LEIFQRGLGTIDGVGYGEKLAHVVVGERRV
jgi:hypothetical protein